MQSSISRFLRQFFDFLGKLRVGLGILQLAALPVTFLESRQLSGIPG